MKETCVESGQITDTKVERYFGTGPHTHEIDKSGIAAVFEQDVRGLQIAVRYVAVVHRSDESAEIECQPA